MDYLISKKVDLNAQDEDGWTALHFAATNNRPETVRVLLEEGADKKKAAVWAIKSGHLDLANYIHGKFAWPSGTTWEAAVAAWKRNPRGALVDRATRRGGAVR